MIKYMLITNSVPLAKLAVASGVDRIFIDLEKLGKAERQGHLDTHKADHEVGDVAAVRAALADAEILVRCNPLHAGSRDEIRAVVDAGADIVMLPMFTSCEEVEAFCTFVGARTRKCLLLETPQALARLSYLCDMADRFDEVHIGLNDLHLGLGLTFMFELLGGGLVEYAAGTLRGRGITFGFGGIARVGYGAVPAERVLGEHVRLGSERLILSRDFSVPLSGDAPSVGDPSAAFDLREEIGKLRDWEARYRDATPEELTANAQEVRHLITRVSARQRTRSRSSA